MTAGQNRIPVNLDYAASTPMRAEARLAQREYDDSELAGVNPNSLHSLGRKAAARLEVARREIARSFGARVRPSEIILTNGGTEANQLALLGLAEGARQRDRKRGRVIVSAIEHDSILDNLPLLRAAGFTVDLVQPCRMGYIEPATLVELLGDDVALVSIMVANNETGVVQPIRELAAATHTVGALFHTDAIQGYLHIPLDVTELGVDAMTVAAHKIGGPVASGALYLKNRTPLRPRIFGGGQEAGRRAGTQDLRTQLAFAAAARTLAPHVALERAKLQALPTSSTPRLRPTSAFTPPWATTHRPIACRAWCRSTLMAWTPRSSSSSSMPPALRFRPARRARAAAWTRAMCSAPWALVASRH